MEEGGGGEAVKELMVEKEVGRRERAKKRWWRVPLSVASGPEHLPSSMVCERDRRVDSE